MTVANLGTMVLQAAVNENDIGQVEIGQSATVTPSGCSTPRAGRCAPWMPARSPASKTLEMLSGHSSHTGPPAGSGSSTTT